ncbi:MAG: MmgE/PrpD family protein [Pseudomonadota bacterium]
MDSIASFAQHVVERSYDDLPESARSAAKALILDTIGVGIVGSSGPMAEELAQLHASDGAAGDARVWSLGTRLPAAAAALCNAYQIHNSEFDCVHEEAVAHVLSAVLPASLAHAERIGGVSGKQLIEAVVLGVDVASCLGVAAQSGLRFFRPATVGGLGAAAAVGKLMQFDETRMINALSITYGQLCGTMQAHTEGSMLLAMQMGFNARNSVIACDMAAAGFEGPQNILEGPFGYFRLFEAAGEPAEVAATLGKIWRIEEVAHKPFPSGRATHGVVDACLELKKQHGFSADDVEQVHARVPPLVHHLVGRPFKTEMDINYARLCAAFTSACVLVKDGIGFDDFRTEVYQDNRIRRLAESTVIEVQDGGDPNALTPVTVHVRLKDQSEHMISLDAVYGAPDRPMLKDAALAKLRTNCSLGKQPLAAAQVDQLIDNVDHLEEVTNVAQIVNLMIG